MSNVTESTKKAVDTAREKATNAKPKSAMAKLQEKCKWGDEKAKPAPKKKKKKESE